VSNRPNDTEIALSAIEDPLDRSLAMAYMDLHDAERALMERIVTMPAEQVAPSLHMLTDFDGVIGRLRATLEARATADGLREWTAPDGTVYEFDGTHKRVVKDVRGLYEALIGCPIITSADMNAIFRQKQEVLFTRLNELADRDEDVRAVRDDFAVWSNGPMHLRKKEEKHG